MDCLEQRNARPWKRVSPPKIIGEDTRLFFFQPGHPTYIALTDKILLRVLRVLSIIMRYACHDNLGQTKITASSFFHVVAVLSMAR